MTSKFIPFCLISGTAMPSKKSSWFDILFRKINAIYPHLSNRYVVYVWIFVLQGVQLNFWALWLDNFVSIVYYLLHFIQRSPLQLLWADSYMSQLRSNFLVDSLLFKVFILKQWHIDLHLWVDVKVTNLSLTFNC